MFTSSFVFFLFLFNEFINPPSSGVLFVFAFCLNPAESGPSVFDDLRMKLSSLQRYLLSSSAVFFLTKPPPKKKKFKKKNHTSHLGLFHPRHPLLKQQVSRMWWKLVVSYVTEQTQQAQNDIAATRCTYLCFMALFDRTAWDVTGNWMTCSKRATGQARAGYPRSILKEWRMMWSFINDQVPLTLFYEHLNLVTSARQQKSSAEKIVAKLQINWKKKGEKKL